MPSKKRQIGIRLSPDNEEQLATLQAAMRAATGIDVTITDVINAALVELRKRYLPSAGKKESSCGRT